MSADVTTGDRRAVPELSEAQALVLMREALREAQLGLSDGEAPIGCVIATLGNVPEIVARGHNRVRGTGRKVAHAEMIAFEHTCLPSDRPMVLVSTLEPCVMCLGACMEAAIERVVFGLAAPADNGTQRVKPPQSPGTFMPVIRGGLLAAESRALFSQFVARYRGLADTRYAEQLLALT